MQIPCASPWGLCLFFSNILCHIWRKRRIKYLPEEEIAKSLSGGPDYCVRQVSLETVLDGSCCEIRSRRIQGPQEKSFPVTCARLLICKFDVDAHAKGRIAITLCQSLRDAVTLNSVAVQSGNLWDQGCRVDGTAQVLGWCNMGTKTVEPGYSKDTENQTTRTGRSPGTCGTSAASHQESREPTVRHTVMNLQRNIEPTRGSLAEPESSRPV